MKNMRRVILIDSPQNYRLWKAEWEGSGIELHSLSQEGFTPQELEELAARVEKEPGTTVAVYSSHGMDFRLESFLRRIQPLARLVPVGSEAVLLGLATAKPTHVEAVNRYSIYGGEENARRMGRYVRRHLLEDELEPEPEPPVEIPFDGIFRFDNDTVYPTLASYIAQVPPEFSQYVGVFVHRHGWIRGDMAAVEALCRAVEAQGIGVIAVFSSSDSESKDFRGIVETYFSLEGQLFIQGLFNFQLFAIKAQEGRSVSQQSILELERLNIPVFAPIQSYYLNEKTWRESSNPLTSDMPMGLITPEMSGMIEPILIGVRDDKGRSVALPNRVELMARRAASWLRLRRKPNEEKKVCLMLHNAVCSGVEATIGKAYGLDAMESVVQMMRRLRREGYQVENIPKDGQTLLALLMEKKAFSDFRWTAVEDIVAAGGCVHRMPVQGEYETYFQALPEASRAYMELVWGPPPGEGMVLDGELIITGLRFGNVLVMVQPKRGCYGAKCTGEVCKILHDPACPPPHQYLAAYRYIRDGFAADALIDVGTEGSTEFLPGKTNALSAECWPLIVQDSLPSLYAYSAGVLGEAMLAKRRMNAVILDYLPPASMGADENSRRLAGLINEYQNALQLDNNQAPALKQSIETLAAQLPAAQRMLDESDGFDGALDDIRAAITRADSARLISGPNHVFGCPPEKEEAARYVREVWQAEGRDADEPIEGPDAESILAGLARTTDELDNLVNALSGGYVPGGESGMPDENGRNILPTGRNMFGAQIDKIPTRAAWERGVELSNQLLESYRRDEGRLPEKAAMNMISLDITRSGGEQLSQFLSLIGIRPVWDKWNRVTGLEPILLAELGRPRVDVTVRISGVLRDAWPSAVQLMDEAVLLASSLDEMEEDNYLLKHIRDYCREFGVSHQEGQRQASIRIFGDPPGTYGAGLDLALLASAWKNEEDLAKYFIQASAFAYGKELDGKKSVREFVHNAKNVELSTDTTHSRRMNTLACGFSTQVQGGFRLLARHLGGQSIRQYQSISEKGGMVKTESLGENLNRGIEDTLLNPFWQQSLIEHGYEGASDMMHALQNVFSSQVVIECFDDALLDRVAEATVNNDDLRKWLEEVNPYALEEMARRLLELQTRGRWNPDGDVLEQLKENYLLIEGDMEGRLESAGDIQGGSVDIINDEEIELWRRQLTDIETEMARSAGRNTP